MNEETNIEKAGDLARFEKQGMPPTPQGSSPQLKEAFG